MGGGDGELLSLVHFLLQFSQRPSPINNSVTESIVINVNIAGYDLSIANVYIPPAFSLYYIPQLHPFIANAIVLEWSPRSGLRGDSDANSDLPTSEFDANNFAS